MKHLSVMAVKTGYLLYFYYIIKSDRCKVVLLKVGSFAVELIQPNTNDKPFPITAAVLFFNPLVIFFAQDQK